MCHGWALYTKLNRLNERCLRLTYNEKQATFEQVLDKNKCVHISDLQTHVTDIHKAVNGSTPWMRFLSYAF